jgi:hypothetical protein
MKTILHEIVEASPKLAPRTKTKYLQDLDQWVAFAGPDPSGWTRYRAQEFYGHLLQRMKPQSANRVMASVAHASSWLAKRENRPDMHFAVYQAAPHAARAERRALSPTEAQALLGTCAGTSALDLRDRALIVVGLETGMRRMSLAGMTIDGIQQQAQHGYPVALVPLKGSREALYAVPLSDAAMDALSPWLGWLKAHKIRKGPVFRALGRGIGPKGKLVHTPSDAPLSFQSIYKVVVSRAEQAGLGHLHPHVFRHTFITWRVEAGLQPYQIAVVTGHKVANIPGLSGMGGYLDVGRLGSEIRQTTPAWLAQAAKGAP